MSINLKRIDVGNMFMAFAVGVKRGVDAPYEMSGDGWNGGIFGFCPVQANGKAGEQEWFFRARWDQWSLEVRDRDGQVIAEYSGSHEDASWMKYSEAWAIIGDCLGKFIASR